jgi:hypothetical protein
MAGFGLVGAIPVLAGFIVTASQRACGGLVGCFEAAPKSGKKALAASPYL